MPEILVPLGFFATVVALALGVPFVRALGRRWDREALPGAATPEIAQRLERMEQTLDAMAIEVERVSENQRFTTRLLSERGAGRADRTDRTDRTDRIGDPAALGAAVGNDAPRAP